jgi:hypothetical protein
MAAARAIPAMRPDPRRAGLVGRDGAVFEHYCAVCGAWGLFSNDADPSRGKDGTWFCRLHDPGAARDEARRRLAPLDSLARGLLVQAEEARAGCWRTVAVRVLKQAS